MSEKVICEICGVLKSKSKIETHKKKCFPRYCLNCNKQLFGENKRIKFCCHNCSVEYFKKREVFNKSEFEEEVFQNDDLRSSFKIFDKAYREEKDFYKKKLILEYLVDFKATTLQMNWKAQKNEKLWKRSYKAYNQLSGLSLSNYFSSAYSTKLKKQDLFYRLPLFVGYKFFRWRFDR